MRIEGPHNFVHIPSLRIAIATNVGDPQPPRYGTEWEGSCGEGWEGSRQLNWFDIKLLVQRRLGPDYFLPTSSQWSKAREYLLQNHPEIERDFLRYNANESQENFEIVDSLIAIPDKAGKYPLKFLEGREGRAPILIEQSRVEESEQVKVGHYYIANYVITEGKVREIPELPLADGYIQEWNEDSGLPTRVGKEPCGNFEGAHFHFFTTHGKQGTFVVGKRCSLMNVGSAYKDMARYSTTLYSPSEICFSFRLAKAEP